MKARATDNKLIMEAYSEASIMPPKEKAPEGALTTVMGMPPEISMTDDENPILKALQLLTQGKAFTLTDVPNDAIAHLQSNIKQEDNTKFAIGAGVALGAIAGVVYLTSKAMDKGTSIEIEGSGPGDTGGTIKVGSNERVDPNKIEDEPTPEEDEPTPEED